MGRQQEVGEVEYGGRQEASKGIVRRHKVDAWKLLMYQSRENKRERVTCGGTGTWGRFLAKDSTIKRTETFYAINNCLMINYILP